MYVFVLSVEPIAGVGLRPNERRLMMRPQLAKWITDIGAEVRVRTNVAALQARSQRIQDLLKVIAEREAAIDAAINNEKRVNPS
jgi:hypothetical protein